jgi:hypothetical protein
VTRVAARGVVVAAICAAVALAGCGGGDDKKPQPSDPETAAVERVLADLQAASRRGDGKRICNTIFTVKLADSITRSAKSGSCAKEVRKKLFSPQTRITVKSVKVSEPADATAIVTEQNGNTSKVLLIKQSGQWRIRGVQPT